MKTQPCAGYFFACLGLSELLDSNNRAVIFGEILDSDFSRSQVVYAQCVDKSGD